MTDYWRPETLDDLRSFIDNGVARESRWIEFKRELPSNRSLARQLAAFAIEGGAIVIGVTEEADNRFTVTPIYYAGLRERVEQIAQSAVEPPLWVESRVLADDGGDQGALWIDVPQSPDAPHQVGGTYYERGDTQSRPMSDAAVERLMRSRSSSLDDITTYMHDALRDDPIPQGIGRTCIVAKPIGATPRELYNATGGQADWQTLARELREARPAGEGNLSRLKWLHEPSGSWGTATTPGYADDPRTYFKLAFKDDGALVSLTYSQSRDPECLLPGSAIAACLDAVAVLGFVGEKTGRRHLWDIAIGITGTRDRTAKTLIELAFEPDIPLPNDGYESALRAASIQLGRDPWGIARDLTQRFIEGCGLQFEREARALGYVPPATEE